MSLSFQYGPGAINPAYLKQYDYREVEMILADRNALLEALKYYDEAMAYLFKKIDFGSSFLDAKAITYMNESGIKAKAAIAKAEGNER